MKRPKTVDEYVDLVHQAVYEIDEFRTGLDYEPENAELFGPFIEQLDAMVRKVYDDMVNGKYVWGMGDDLPYMPLVVKFAPGTAGSTGRRAPAGSARPEAWRPCPTPCFISARSRS